MYNKGYGKFTFTYCSYGAPKNMTSPCLDKMSKTSFVGMELTQNPQEMCKTKTKITAGLRHAPILHTPHFYGWGGGGGVILSPPPPTKIGLKGKYHEKGKFHIV